MCLCQYPAETGVQIYNSFSKLQKNGKKNENFHIEGILFRNNYYFYVPEKTVSGNILQLKTLEL